MAKIRLKDEKTRVKTPCCPQRLRIVGGDWNQGMEVSCDPGLKAPTFKLTDSGEPQPYHSVFYSLAIDLHDGAGFLPVPLPSDGYLDMYQMAGAFAHQFYSPNSGVLLLPLCGGHLAYRKTDGKWNVAKDMKGLGYYIGQSSKGDFVFASLDNEIHLVSPATLEPVLVSAVTRGKLMNAHLSEDLTQLLTINQKKERGNRLFCDLIDLETSQVGSIQADLDTVNAALYPSVKALTFPLCEPDNTPGGLPIPRSGDNCYGVRVVFEGKKAQAPETSQSVGPLPSDPVMEELIQKIRDRVDADDVGVVATEGMILNFQNQMGVELPASYISFMKAFNGGEHPLIRMYSMGGGIWNMEEMLEGLIDRVRLVQQKKLVPIGDDYSGAPIYLDYRKKKIDPPVILWDEGEDRPEKLAENFLEFMTQSFEGKDGDSE